MMKPRHQYTVPSDWVATITGGAWRPGDHLQLQSGVYAGITGQGQTIVLMRYDLYSAADWSTFRSPLIVGYSGSLSQTHPAPPSGPNIVRSWCERGLWRTILDASMPAPSAERCIQMAACADTQTRSAV